MVPRRDQPRAAESRGVERGPGSLTTTGTSLALSQGVEHAIESALRGCEAPPGHPVWFLFNPNPRRGRGRQTSLWEHAHDYGTVCRKIVRGRGRALVHAQTTEAERTPAVAAASATSFLPLYSNYVNSKPKTKSPALLQGGVIICENPRLIRFLTLRPRGSRWGYGSRA